MLDNYGWAIEELSLSGAIGLGNCSISTLYRWARKINERLETEHCVWRVKANPKTKAIEVKAQ